MTHSMDSINNGGVRLLEVVLMFQLVQANPQVQKLVLQDGELDLSSWIGALGTVGVTSIESEDHHSVGAVSNAAQKEGSKDDL